MMFNINFREHPSRHNTYVFQFSKEEHANYFEQLLEEKGIEYEKNNREEDNTMVYYYGIKKVNFEAAKTINFLVSAKYRKPFIEDKFLRFFIITISISAVVLAITGYLLANW